MTEPDVPPSSEHDQPGAASGREAGIPPSSERDQGDGAASGREAGIPPSSERDQKRREPQSIADALVSALSAAGPEAAEHVVTAGHELRRAAEAVIAAVTGALREHRPGTEAPPGSTPDASDGGAERGQS